MSLATVYSRAKVGIQASLVTVEAHLSNGLPSFSIVGLPETAVKESKDRVRSAIINSNLKFPVKRITVNLAPADLPKEGGRFDLPIALSILAASQQIEIDKLDKITFVGELALSGHLRPIIGVLPVTICSTKAKHSVCIPASNANEAGLYQAASILPAKHLLDICSHLNNHTTIRPHKNKPVPPSIFSHTTDFKDVMGQYLAKRALEIAAAGRHNILMLGPPGSGKTMLANRMQTILPPMSVDEALDVANLNSIVIHTQSSQWNKRPFRNPHHTISGVALVGGGSIPRPGEISLAHNGILFLDEVAEYSRKILDLLREPLESGEMVVSRINQQVKFPANFQLVAAMNPCPCGYTGSNMKECRCSIEQIKRYQTRISGPLLDRIDMHIEVPQLKKQDFTLDIHSETSQDIRARVKQAWEVQIARQGKLNADLSIKEINKFCNIETDQATFLNSTIEKLGLSARAYHKILKVARTIADLNKCDQITNKHITATMGYRLLDRQLSI